MEEKQETTESEFVDARFDRQWSDFGHPREGWKAWYGRWMSAQAVEEAEGLIHGIPLRHAVAVRFLAALIASHGLAQEHRCLRYGKALEHDACRGGKVGRAALRKLVFGFLKRSEEERRHRDVPAWWGFFAGDRSLLSTVLELFIALDAAFVRSGDADGVIQAFLEDVLVGDPGRSWSWSGLQRELVGQHRTLLYEAALRYDLTPRYPGAFAQELGDHLEALRTIAFRKRSRLSEPPVDLDAAVAAGGHAGMAARAFLLHSAYGRHDKREREERDAKLRREMAARRVQQIPEEIATLTEATAWKRESLETELREHLAVLGPDAGQPEKAS